MIELAAMSDEELIHRYAKANDRSAFESLLQRHFQNTYRLALKMLGDPAAADDAAQNAFVSLLRKAYRFEEGRPFRPWYYAIVMNAIRQEGRKRQRRQVKEQDAAVSELVVQRNWDEPFIREEIEKTLCYLSEEDRMAVILHFYEGKTHSDIAVDLGVPKGTVSTRIRRGLKQLKEIMSKSGYAGSVLGIEEAFRSLSSQTSGIPLPSARILERRANRWLAQSIIVKATVVAVGALLLSLILVPEFSEEPDHAGEKQAIARNPKTTTNSASALPKANSDRNGSEGQGSKGLESVQGGDKERNRGLQNDGAGSNAVKGRTASSTAARKHLLKIKVVDESGRPEAKVKVSVVVPDRVGGTPQYRNDIYRQGSLLGITNAQGELLTAIQPHRLAGRSCFRIYGKRGIALGRSEDLTLAGISTLSESGGSVSLVLKDPLSPSPDQSSLILTHVGKVNSSEKNLLRGMLKRLDDLSFRRLVCRNLTKEGQVAFHELSPGSYRLTAYLSGFAEQSFDFLLVKGQATNSELRFNHRESILYGAAPRLQSRSKAARRALLYRFGEQTLLHSRSIRREGRFRFDGLAPGDYVVKVTHGDFPGRIHWQKVVIEKAGQSIELDPIEIPSRISVTGALSSESGRPISGRALALVKKGIGVIAGAKSSAAGRFEFYGVKPGKYSLIFEGSQKLILADVTIADDRCLSLGEVVFPGEESPGSFTVLFPKTGLQGELHCQLTMPGFLQKLSASWTEQLYWVSKRKGRVYFQAQVSDGYYTPVLTVDFRGSGGKKLEVAEWLPGGHLKGRLKSLSSIQSKSWARLKRVGRGLPFSSYQALIQSNGCFQFNNLAPGRYQLSIDSSTLVQSIVIPAGKTITADFPVAGEQAELAVTVNGDGLKDHSLRLFWLSEDRRVAGALCVEKLNKSHWRFQVNAGEVMTVHGRRSELQFRGVVRKQTVLATQDNRLKLSWSENLGRCQIEGKVRAPHENQTLRVYAVSEASIFWRDVSKDGEFRLTELPAGSYRVFLGENPYVDWSEGLLCALSKGETRTLTTPIPRLSLISGRD